MLSELNVDIGVPTSQRYMLALIFNGLVLEGTDRKLEEQRE